MSDKKSSLRVTVEEHRDDNNASPVQNSILTARSPRTTRFAEATTVISPAESTRKSPWQGAPIEVSAKPSSEQQDVPFSSGFSNNIKHTSVVMPTTPFTPVTARTPGALKVPGTPGRYLDPRSPTFREELAVEKEEVKAEKQNAADIKVKTRIRVAKFFLRGVNFGCSLIVLSMLSTTFSIFNLTKGLQDRNNSPAWAPNQQTWPQIVVLVVACISLVTCMCVFYGYWKGGHKRAAKTAGYYTMFSIGFFMFTTIMWIIGAVVLHQSRANGNGKDMWGWACQSNKRETLFNDTVNYALVCRLQNWSLVCALIEITIEFISIIIYVVMFYRFRSKRKLMKSMNNRDRARNDLYLAQLKLQSAPNTPGYAQRTGKPIRSAVAPTFGAISEERDVEANFDERDLEYERRYQATFGNTHPGLAPPAINVTGATPQMGQGEFSANESTENIHAHFDAAEGEQTYDSVPIPGAYAGSKAH